MRSSVIAMLLLYGVFGCGACSYTYMRKAECSLGGLRLALCCLPRRKCDFGFAAAPGSDLDQPLPAVIARPGFHQAAPFGQSQVAGHGGAVDAEPVGQPG